MWTPAYSFPSLPGRLPPEDLIAAIGSGDFYSVGREFFDYFVLLAGLKPEHHVLDIGCGVGRMALQLTRYLNSLGRYEGFDINPLVVEWCQENITSRCPTFSFQYTSLFNSLYNRQAENTAAASSFPYRDDSFDFVCATSVFTHLLPFDFAHYIRETARVLRPGGRSFLTFFLLNDSSRAQLAAQKTNITFDFGFSDIARVHDEEVLEYAIGYDDGFVQQLHAENGLKMIEPVWYGGWNGRPDHLTFQDVIIATKT